MNIDYAKQFGSGGFLVLPPLIDERHTAAIRSLALSRRADGTAETINGLTRDMLPLAQLPLPIARVLRFFDNTVPYLIDRATAGLREVELVTTDGSYRRPAFPTIDGFPVGSQGALSLAELPGYSLLAAVALEDSSEPDGSMLVVPSAPAVLTDLATALDPEEFERERSASELAEVVAPAMLGRLEPISMQEGGVLFASSLLPRMFPSNSTKWPHCVLLLRFGHPVRGLLQRGINVGDYPLLSFETRTSPPPSRVAATVRHVH